jgi:phosphatidylserine/phosphatidylglycerophosphate/cardiolipin synthase-like enzyme
MRIIYRSIEEYIITSVRTAINEITVVCPFIKIEPLARILSFSAPTVKVYIITSWKLENFLAGVSDVELFSYCRNKAIDLRANNRLHMKIWLIDRSQLLATSANISDRALGATVNFNYEFLVDSAATEIDLKAIDEIRDESTIIDEDIYRKQSVH